MTFSIAYIDIARVFGDLNQMLTGLQREKIDIIFTQGNFHFPFP